jgi:hypothetical protein
MSRWPARLPLVSVDAPEEAWCSWNGGRQIGSWLLLRWDQLIILIAAACRAGRLDVPEPHHEPIQVPPERLQPGT